MEAFRLSTSHMLHKMLDSLPFLSSKHNGTANTKAFLNLCTFVGGFYVSKAIYDVLNFTKTNLIDRPLDFESRYGKKSWVIVTGATGSIGGAFCDEFAKRNFNLILIGRNPAKLDQSKKELEGRYAANQIEVRTIVSDFSKAADDGWIDDVMNQIGVLNEDKGEKGCSYKVMHNISVLVNVAGMENVKIPYSDASTESIRKVLIVNNFPVVLLTSRIMPLLKERYEKSKLRGAVVTVAAEAAKLVFPGMTIYAATKALANNFTIAAGVEYDNFGVDTLSVNPLGVSSNMVQEEPDGLAMITAEQCAQSSMKQLGRKRETNGWWFHSIQHNILASMPSELFYYVFPKIVKKKFLEKD